MKHTPTPWEVRKTRRNWYVYQYCHWGRSIGRMRTKEDCELVVKAVNNHDALIAALTDCAQALTMLRDGVIKSQVVFGAAQGVLENARALLKAVENENL